MYTEYDKYDESYAYCLNCKQTVPRSAIKQIVYPATHDDPEERVYVCPSCDSEDGDFEDAEQCRYCGEWRGWEQMSDKDDMCRECYDKALRQLRRYAERQETGDCTAVLNYLLAGI